MTPKNNQGLLDLEKLSYWRRYQSTLIFILYVAAKKCFPSRTLRVEHSMSKGLYCLLDSGLTTNQIRKLQKTMQVIIDQDHPIENRKYSRKKALVFFKRKKFTDKVLFLKNLRIQNITIFSLLSYLDYYTVPPLESTGAVQIFQLKRFSPGLILLFPTWQNITKLPTYIAQPRLARIFNEYEKWARILGISDIYHLNQAICDGRGREIIKISEALHEKKIAYIADRIMKKKKRLVLIAGPSCAGKTTFTKRLAIQLMVNGIKPLIMSADDYFLPHSKTPRDQKGRLDFESILAVDRELLNRHLNSLLKNKKVNMPKFNFHTGRRNKGDTIILPQNSIILLEGIHCLNNKLTNDVSNHYKFKIYVSALTQLNIDHHNRISTTDTRMLRRMVRDTHFRGYRVKEVLRHIPSIRNGEEKNIYPFQEQADEMFNSALIYEPAILKKYFLPIIKRVGRNAPEYAEARRYIDFLNLFRDLNDRHVPSNSILREFIGQSSFEY